MSAVPATKPAPRVEERRRHRTHRRPAPRPKQQISRKEERARARRRSALAAQVTTFVIIAGLVFMASSLFGHVMVEKARREGLRAAERAREARKMEAILRQKIDYLSSLSTVEAWATAHSFVAPDGVVQPVASTPAGQVTRVAANR